MAREPITEMPRPVASVPMPPVETSTTTDGVHPMMIGSLPNIASGADVYARQFYRGSKVPFRRYLPINIG